MDTFLLRVFQGQALVQCRYVLIAIEGLDEAMKSNTPDRIWFFVQAILGAGANLSRLFWGSRLERSPQRVRLRESIGIDDRSPLIDVRMRNHFEHIDARIDRWWAGSQNRNYADKIVGPASAVVGMDPIDMFRFFDPSTGNVTFWGDEFNLALIADEVRRILPKLEAEVAKPHWD